MAEETAAQIYAKHLKQVPQPLQGVIKEYMFDGQFDGFLEGLKAKHTLTDEQESLLTTECMLVLCNINPLDGLKDEIIVELGLPYEAALRIQRAFEEEVHTKILPEAEKRGFQPDASAPQDPLPQQAAPSSIGEEGSNALYQDYACRVTRSTLQIGNTSYPLRNIASLTAPLQESFELFGGFLLNGAFAILGLMGILSFSPLWMILGAIAALIGGFNVRNQFRRPWFIFVHFTNGEKEMITRQNEAEIRGLYSSLQSAIR